MRARSLLALPVALALIMGVAPAAGAATNSALLGPVLGDLPAKASGGGSGTPELNAALETSCGGSGGVAFVSWFSLPRGDLGLLKAQGQGSIGWIGRVPIEMTVHQALVDARTASVLSCTGIARVSADQDAVVAVWLDRAEYDRVRQCANPMWGCGDPWMDVHVGPTTGVVPPNDHVDSAMVIRTFPFDVAGDRTLADDEGPELFGMQYGGVDHQVASVWYRFTAPATGEVPISAPGNDIGVGHVVATGVDPVVGGGTWPVVAGEDYLIKVSTDVEDYAHEDPLPRGRLFHLYVGAVGAPGPFVVSASSGPAGSISLAWTGPAVADPTQSVEITVEGPGAGPTFVVPLGAATQTHTVTGLTTGAAYTVRTRLRNAVGWGVPGETHVHAGPTALDGESVFRADAVVNAATASAELTWYPAYDDPQPVTGYRVSRDGLDSFGVGPWSTVLPSTATSFTFTHLVRGTTYRFSVTPVTADGDRPSWTLSAPVLRRPAVPGADLGLSYYLPDGAGRPQDGYKVVWAPPSSDGQSPITGYRVTRDGVDADGNGPLVLDLPASARTVILPNLRGNVSYRIGVRAINSAGLGPEESLIAWQIQPDPPAPPTDVKAVPADSSALVSWSPPSTWGSLPAAHYEIYWRMDGGPSTLAYSTDKDATSATVPGLINGHSYTFTVQAWSTDSASPESAPSAPVVIGPPPRPGTTVPGAPVVGRATALAVSGKVRAVVRWAAPVSDGGSPVTAYRVYAYSLYPSGALMRRAAVSPVISPTARSATMTLPAGGYRFLVRAVNAIGYSQASALSNRVRPMTVPGAPVIGTAISGAKGGAITATATWTPPKLTGGTPVTAYVVYAYRVSSSGRILSTTVSTKLPARYRSYVFPYLTYGWYRFSVRAINVIGYSAYSAKSLRVIGR